eukprot:comp19054_c0_seq1/m.21494 comp19054_c0_seq1/g.21494  ORF comp19054_c0_seq1/g.21494 comp19054_c0_seq1/m.21494 type:complete len:182 (-) comp19054_c0_seq1:159-704(-)
MAGRFAALAPTVSRATTAWARSYGSSVGSDITIKQLVMDRKGAVMRVPKEMTVNQAAKTMNEKNVGSVIVLDGDKVHGIVTERDFLKKVVVPNADAGTLTVGEIATTKVIAVDETETVSGCMSLMTQEGLRHLPVVRNGSIVDVISIRDLVHAVHEGQKAELHYLREFLGYQGNMYSAASS